MKKILIGLFLLFAVESCKSTMPTVTSEQTATKIITETVHDTVFKIQKDSSSYKSYLDCTNGKISIVTPSIEHQKGRSLSMPKVAIKDNYITVDCQLQEQELYAKWKQSNTLETKTTTNTKIVEVNKLTFWQELQIYSFWAIVATAGLIFGYFRIKNYLKTI